MKAAKNQFHIDVKTYSHPPLLWIASPALADNPIIAEDHNTEKEEADMAAVEMKDKKKEMIEKTAQEFQKLNGDKGCRPCIRRTGGITNE